MINRAKLGEWWYNLSVRTGIYIFGAVMISVSMATPLIHSFTGDEGVTPVIIDGIMLMFLVLSSVIVGALLGIDFQKHEYDKEKNKTKSGK